MSVFTGPVQFWRDGAFILPSSGSEYRANFLFHSQPLNYGVFCHRAAGEDRNTHPKQGKERNDKQEGREVQMVGKEPE